MKPLFTWKDIEGKEQYKTIEEVGYLLNLLQKRYGRNIFNLLSKADSKIIGLAILGSTVKGYAVNPVDESNPSDVEVSIIYDDPGSNNTDQLEQTVSICFPKFEKKAQRNIEFLGAVNVARLTQERVIKNPNLYIGGLLYPILGNISRIKQCHDKVRTLISHLSLEEKEDWVRNFSDGIYEDKTVSKQIERGFIRAEEKEEYKEERRQLYEKRIRKLFID